MYSYPSEDEQPTKEEEEHYRNCLEDAKKFRSLVGGQPHIDYPPIIVRCFHSHHFA